MQTPALPFEQFQSLGGTDCVHAFVHRVPGIDVPYDKQEVLARLDQVHRDVRQSLALKRRAFVTAEQVHGKEIGLVDTPIATDKCFAGCDGLITNQPGVCLGIYVADCCAVYLFDPVHRAICVVHSGKKGTELGIVPRAIALLQEKFGSRPNDLIVQLSPCIRPPHYEIDFAAEITKQGHAAGVEKIVDSGLCTACDLDRYYSYRAEKGKTGRMLALLALK